MVAYGDHKPNPKLQTVAVEALNSPLFCLAASLYGRSTTSQHYLYKNYLMDKYTYNATVTTVTVVVKYTVIYQ